MLEGLDEGKLAAIRASTKAGCIAGLSEAIGVWNRHVLDRLPLKTSLEKVIEKYSYHMGRLTHLPEQDRVEVLEAYARAASLRENRTTATQSIYVTQIKKVDDLDNLPPGRRFIDDIILVEGGSVRDFSSAAILYIVSHTALGLSLPSYFSDITHRMKDYLLDPDNQASVVDEGGVIRLDPFIRVHAMFLEAHQEIVKDEQPLIETVAADQEEETPFRFDDEGDILEKESEERFQRIQRTKEFRD